MNPDRLLTIDLVLRPPEAADGSNFVDLWVSGGQPESQAESEFQRLLANGGPTALMLQSKSTQALAGFLDWTRSHVPLVVITPELRLRGYATQAFDRASRLRTDRAELCLEMQARNTPARHLAERCAYQYAGRTGERVHYRSLTEDQRCRQLQMLDRQYQRAVKERLSTTHRGLAIAADYGSRHKLEPALEATELLSIGDDLYGRRQYLLPQAAVALQALIEAAAGDQQTIQVVSAYRSVPHQTSIIQRKLNTGTRIEEILKVSAAPGYSEHHSGRAVDLASPDCPALEEQFETTPAFAWLSRNAARFGFSLSYPRNNPYGITYEPWHWAHVGAKRAENPRSETEPGSESL